MTDTLHCTCTRGNVYTFAVLYWHPEKKFVDTHYQDHMIPTDIWVHSGCKKPNISRVSECFSCGDDFLELFYNLSSGMCYNCHPLESREK